MLLRVLAVLALVSAPALAQLNRDELFKAATGMYRKDYVDYQRWKSTDRHYQIRTENELRLTLMNRWHWDHLAKRLRWFRRQDWPQEFKTMFVRAVQWHRETYDGGTDKLYRLSKEYQNRPNAEKYGYLTLSGRLLSDAAEAGHEKAMKEVLDHPAHNVWPPDLYTTRRVHYRRAVSGQFNAMFSLALTYTNAPVFDADLTKAFYWYSRLQKSRLSEKMIRRFDERNSWVSPEQRKQALSWIESGHVPPM